MQAELLMQPTTYLKLAANVLTMRPSNLSTIGH